MYSQDVAWRATPGVQSSSLYTTIHSAIPNIMISAIPNACRYFSLLGTRTSTRWTHRLAIPNPSSPPSLLPNTLHLLPVIAIQAARLPPRSNYAEVSGAVERAVTDGGLLAMRDY